MGKWSKGAESATFSDLSVSIPTIIIHSSPLNTLSSKIFSGRDSHLDYHGKRWSIDNVGSFQPFSYELHDFLKKFGHVSQLIECFFVKKFLEGGNQ